MSAEQLTCSMQLLGLVPMHSDSQQFVRFARWFETFTAITRVESVPKRWTGMRIVCLPSIATSIHLIKNLEYRHLICREAWTNPPSPTAERPIAEKVMG